VSAPGYVAALVPVLTGIARGGHDLPDILSTALQETAIELGSVEALVSRPGSWEAAHVEALAAPARDEIEAGAVPVRRAGRPAVDR